METYGLYLMAVFIILGTTATVGMYGKKDHYFIKCRNPFFLVVQNIGTFIALLVLCVYITLRPDIDCAFLFFGYTISYSGVGVPLLVRGWAYCVGYHISRLKVQYRSSCFKENWVAENKSWFLRNKWVASIPFLSKMLMIGIVCGNLPLLYIAIGPSEFTYDLGTNTCTTHLGLQIASSSFAIVLLITALCLASLIRKSQDAFLLRREIDALFIMWICVLGVFPLYANYGISSPKSFPPSLIIISALIGTFVLSTVLPLFLVYRNYRFDKNQEEGINFDGFALLLNSVHFRNIFHDFLSKQFCQENLQFYEVVVAWRDQSNGPEKNKQANLILENFVLEGGICQVHMIGQTRDKIKDLVLSARFEETVFDEAVDELLNEMFLNSFSRFKSSNLFTEACQGRLV